MDAIYTLEQTLARWYKNAPHLPKKITEWIAGNAWWLMVVGIIIGIFITLRIFLLSGLLVLLSGSIGDPLIGASFLVQIIPFSLVTISLGIAVLKEDIYNPETLLPQADQALYEAKKTGRNRICIYQEKITGR